jgi:ATP diphosphatase
MVRRHPHVFGDARFDSVQAQAANWEALKADERAASGDEDASALAGISRGMPEWQRALKLQQKAARVGFDWPDVAPVFDKLHEEIDEVRAEFAAGADAARLADEIGDVLFVCVNLARHAKVDVSQALRHANAKFERRFRRMEAFAADEGTRLDALDLDAQDADWVRAKREER